MTALNIPGFDESFYVKAYHDTTLNPRLSPAKHYLQNGKRFDRLRSAEHFRSLYPEFDALGYYHSNSDLHKLSPEQRMSHYHHTGKKEGRKCQKETVSQELKNLFIRSENSQHKVKNYFKTNVVKDVSLKEVKDNFIFLLNSKLLKILDLVKGNKKYVVLNDWGLPAFGGGECWMIDTMKWMTTAKYKCIYIYFYNHRTGQPFTEYHVKIEDHGIFIEFPITENIYLLQFLILLEPSVISHQGNSRLHHMKIANLINCPFVSGFCFWQDIIELENTKAPDGSSIPFNKNMLSSSLVPSQNFQVLKNHSEKLYVCGEFPNDIIAKVHGENEKLSVFHTITDESSFLKETHGLGDYITVMNISKYKGGLILEAIIENVQLEIPFYIIDSQKSSSSEKLSKSIEVLINRRNREVRKRNERENLSIKESIYIDDHIEDVKEIYGKSRILLIPSLVDETFCRVAYEGMHNSIPIFSTSNGNLKYVLKDYAHFLDENPKSWSHAINKYYFNEKLKEMSERKKNSYTSKEDFTVMIENVTSKGVINSHAKIGNVGIFAPWCDQGLGIQAREYKFVLEKLGFRVSIFSPYPYPVTHDKTLKAQTDKKEWEGDVYYSSNTREEITDEEFLNYLVQSKISKFIILEISREKVFQLARICKMLSIEVIAVPNLEIVRYTELENYQYFDRILANNNVSYEFFHGILQNKNVVHHIGFRILHKYFHLNLRDLRTDRRLEFFCCGGLNSISRKNIDKIYNAFCSLNAKLFIYIQGIQKPADLKETNNIKIEIGAKTYHDIAKLYGKHDIFIHLGTHEGLGLGFYEAIASGCPVVTIDCPPNNEIIEHRKNGYLVKNNGFQDMTDNDKGIIFKSSVSTESLIECIENIISSPGIKKTDLIEYNHKKFPVNSYIKNWKNVF